MGLLDSITPDDPDTRAALSQALMAAGFGLAGTQGRGTGAAIGQAGMTGLQAFQGARREQRDNKVRDLDAMRVRQAMELQALQMAEAKRRAAQEEAQRAWLQNLPDPQFQAGQDALAGGGGPTVANAAAVRQPDPMISQVYAAVKAGAMPMSALIDAQQKADPLMSVPEGGAVFNRRTGAPVFTNPKEGGASKDPTSVQEYSFAKSQGYAGSYEQWVLQKAQAGAGSTVTMGSPVPVQLPDGTQAFVQPANRPGAAPTIMRVPGTGPLAPVPKAPPVEFLKSVSGLNELENGLRTYEATLRQQGGPNALAMHDKRAALQGSFTSLQMGLKNAFELGALAGPDLGLLNGMLSDPTGLKAQALGMRGVIEQITKAREYLSNRRKAVYDAHGQPMPGSAPARGASPAAPAGLPGADAVAAELARRQAGGR